MKRIKYIGVFLFLFLLMGCSSIEEIKEKQREKEREDNEVIVFFKADGNTVLFEEIITKGSTIEKPEDPIKEGYTFEGWYTEMYLEETDDRFKVDFSEYTTTEHVNQLYGRWEAKTYQISYTDFGGNQNSGDDTVIRDEYITPLTTPDVDLRTGYYFDGWYTDENYTDSFEFTTMPSSDLTVYQKWVKNETAYISEPIILDDSVVAIVNKVYYEDVSSTNHRVLLVDLSVKNNTNDDMVWFDSLTISLTDSDNQQIAEYTLSDLPLLAADENYNAFRVLVPYENIKKNDADLSDLQWRVRMDYRLHE